jgi:hypothetical protein
MSTWTAAAAQPNDDDDDNDDNDDNDENDDMPYLEGA